MAAENFTGTALATSSGKNASPASGASMLPGSFYASDGRGWGLTINSKTGLCGLVKSGANFGGLLTRYDMNSLRNLLETILAEVSSPT